VGKFYKKGTTKLDQVASLESLSCLITIMA